MIWSDILPSALEILGKIFGTIDKAVPDATERDKLKVEAIKMVMGTGSSHWLQANAFSIAMLCNYAMVTVMTLLGKTIPEWAIVVALVWLSGPLMNNLSKETVGRIIEFAKQHKAGSKNT